MRTVVAVIALVACVHAGLWALAGSNVAAPDFQGAQLNSLSYAPYEKSAEQNATANIATIRADMKLLAPYTRAIRTYSSTNGSELVPAAAAEQGLKVTVGAWLDKDADRNEREVRNAIDLARRNNNVNGIVVGNETVFRGEITVPVAGARVGPPRQLLSGLSIDQAPGCKPTRSDPHACAPDLPDAPQSFASWVSSQLNQGTDVQCANRFHVCFADADSVAARRLVDSLKAAGADMIKTYALSRAMYFVIAAEARRVGLPFGGHLYWATAIEASDSGARVLDHLNSSGDLLALCVRKAGFRPDDDGAMAIGFSPIPQLETPNDASVEHCRAVAERFVRNGTWWAPTVLLMPDVYFGGPRVEAVKARYNEYRRQFLQGSAPNPYTSDRTGGPVYPTAGPVPDSLGLLYIVREAGLPILASTDATLSTASGESALPIPGFSLHAELALYVAEGLTPLRALQSATLNPAKAFHLTDSLGTIAPGKLADLVLLDADPLVDIANVAMIRAVVANGRYFDRAALDQLLVEVQAKIKQKP